MKTIRLGGVIGAGLLVAGGATAPAAAQLRPLEPLPFGVLSRGAPEITATTGAAVLKAQRASLAGTEGRLVEIGNTVLTWRTGRVVIELGGTVLRVFEDRARFADPHETIDPTEGPTRHDSGDYRVSTAVRLTPERWDPIGYVRFGTRLPTTDNTVGLDRDRTDFFSTVGVQWSPGPWTLSGEAGLGIHGTHHPRLEQSDVVVYALAAGYRAGALTPEAMLLGHFDGMAGAIRGSEELSEIRLGGRIGETLRVSAHAVRGLTEFSPDWGAVVAVGWRWGR